jgi:hypothetical protein
MLKPFILLLGLIPFTLAQAQNGTSPCDHYSQSALAANGTDAQIKWVNMFVVNLFGGNSSVFAGTTVQGILSAGTYNGVPMHLAKYFDGSLYNTDGKNGLPQAVNWLDDGGQVTLAQGRLANSPTSNQLYVDSFHFQRNALEIRCAHHLSDVTHREVYGDSL